MIGKTYSKRQNTSRHPCRSRARAPGACRRELGAAWEAAKASLKALIAATKDRNRLEIFKTHNANLDQIQKDLEDYLETKRMAFPRFYFLSNDELLEILSQTKDPLAVQQHLSKCFENIAKLEFQPDLQMTAMISGEGETVKFTKGLYPKGGVEFWMTDVLNEMKTTTRQKIIDSTEDYRNTERGEWVLKWPGATLIAVCTIFWSLEVEENLNAKGNQGMHEYYEKSHAQLMQLTLIVSSAGVTRRLGKTGTATGRHCKG